MKLNLIPKFAVLAISLAASATTFADVKIKSIQTMSGQTSENAVYIKGKRQRTESLGGQMISILQCDLRRDVRIVPASQTFQINSFDTSSIGSNALTDDKNSPVTKGGLITMLVSQKDTGERRQMFGYTAKHIISTMETNSSPDACSLTKNKMQIDGWYIDADFALDCAANRAYNNAGQTAGGCQDKTEIKTVGAAIKKGYPVLEKMTLFDASGKETLTTQTEVVELSKATLDAKLFDVPADYHEVKTSNELYAHLGGDTKSNKTPTVTNTNYDGQSENNPPLNQTVKNMSQTKSNVSATVGDKKEGTIRIGLPTVKSGAVGEGVNAQELALAIQNTLGEYLKGSKVELVPLEARLASALENEAQEKRCDFVLYATISHKKGGGGGFGSMFKAVAPIVSNVIPMAGGMGGAIAGSVASTAIMTAANASANVKPKDEITLELKLQNGASNILTKQFKAKAKSAGEDIISPMIEQAAQAIIDATAK